MRKNDRNITLDNNSMKAWGGIQQGLSVHSKISKVAHSLKEYKRSIWMPNHKEGENGISFKQMKTLLVYLLRQAESFSFLSVGKVAQMKCRR